MADILDPRGHLPQYYKDVREIDILSEAIMYVLLNMHNEFRQILANNFIQTANEQGIARFERILDITSDPSLDLETRRQKVLSTMSASTVFTLRVLKMKLKEMCDNGEYMLNLDYNKFHADINVRISKKGMLEVLYDLLYAMTPAHSTFTIKNKLPVDSTMTRFTGGVISIKRIVNINVIDGRR